VFRSAIIEGANKVEAPWFYSIPDWDRYRKFLASPQAIEIERPDNILPVSTFKPIGMDIKQGE
jgi:hypothetical protein